MCSMTDKGHQVIKKKKEPFKSPLVRSNGIMYFNECVIDYYFSVFSIK